MTRILSTLRSIPGRKAVFLFSNNLPPNYSSSVVLPVVDSAFGSSTTIYDCALPGWKLHWSAVAAQTGGYSLKAKTDEFREITELLSDFDQSYILRYETGFKPIDIQNGRRIPITSHSLKAKAKKTGLTLRTRSGFNEVIGNFQTRLNIPPKEFFRNVTSTNPLLAGNMQVGSEYIPFFNSNKESVIHVVLSFRGEDLSFDRQPEDGYRLAKVKIQGQLYLDGKTINTYTGDVVLRAPVQNFSESLENEFLAYFDVPVSSPGLYELRTNVLIQNRARLGNISQLVEVPQFTGSTLVASGIDTFNKLDASKSGPHTSLTTRRLHRSDPFSCSLFVYNAQRDQSGGKANIESQIRFYRDDRLVKASDIVPVESPAGSDPVNGIQVGFEVKPTPELTAGNYLVEILVVDRLANQKKNMIASTVAIELVD